jgi:hypothetical protein
LGERQKFAATLKKHSEIRNRLGNFTGELEIIAQKRLVMAKKRSKENKNYVGWL